MRRCLVPVLLLAALPLLAANREVQTVEVVQVPVYVSTTHGAVTGLARENFQLFVNGKAQPFDYFDVIDFGSLVAPAGTGEGARPSLDPRQRRIYFLLFDLYYSSPKDVHRAQKAAVDLISRRAGRDAFAVGTYTHDRGIDVLVPFTRDAVAIDRAIAALRPSASADPLRLMLTEQEVRPIEAAFDRQELPLPSATPTAAEEILADVQRIRVDDQITALTVLADRLAPLEGQKHVVLLSAGYNTMLLHGATSMTPPARGNLRSGPLGGTDLLPRVPRSFALNGTALLAMRQMYARYASAEVFLDAIDIAGLRHTWEPAENESLYVLTRDTGGSVIDNRNDLAKALEVLTDRQRVVYVLGFHTRNSGRKENRIEVRLRNVDGNPTVRYRPSYGPAPADDVDNGLRLADILMNDTPQHGVSVTAAATGSTVSVAIPARELLAQIDDKNAQAEAMIYVFSGARVVATNVKRIDIEGERAARATGDAAIRFDETFQLPPGTYAAKVLVRLGNALGFARTDFEVPAK